MRDGKNYIKFRNIQDRFYYYWEHELIDDMDLACFETDPSRVPTNAHGSPLDKLFKFRVDDSYDVPTNNKVDVTTINFNRLQHKYDKNVTSVMHQLLLSTSQQVAALMAQAIWRGKVTRRAVNKPDYFKKRANEALLNKKKGMGDGATAMVVVKKFLRSAIARRRVKKAKEERKKLLLQQGKKDDTEEDVYEVEFKVEDKLGFKLRAAGPRNIEKAMSLKLIKSEEEGSTLPEVNIVDNGGYAERMTVAPGDLLLEVNGKHTKLSKLKKTISKAKEGGSASGGKITMKLMRGAVIRAGIDVTKSGVTKEELKGAKSSGVVDAG
jgi:hypothetical protein